MKKEVLIIKNLAAFEKLINRDDKPYQIDMMVMPGTLQDKHKDVDPEKGIPALRRQFNLVYLLTGGEHDVHLGAEYRWLKPNDLVIVPESFLYASTHVSRCTGYCIHFKTEFIQPLLKSTITADFPFFHTDAEHIINISEADSVLVQRAFADIIAEYGRFSPERDYLLRNYIYILLLRVRDIYRPYHNQLKLEISRPAKISSDFRHLVEKHFIHTRKVNDYAEMLHVSTRHLSDVVKETTGKSPRDIINGMLFLEAKVQLGSTDKSITEIAHELRFEDQAHFCHFIRKQAGCTPLNLRKKL